MLRAFRRPKPKASAATAEAAEAAAVALALEKSVPLFVPPGHFYSPICDPEDVKRAFDRSLSQPRPQVLPGLAIDRAAMAALWDELTPHFHALDFPEEPTPRRRYAYNNGFYGVGDGAMLSALICKLRPARIVEIGSGWSSACMLDTLDALPDLACEATFIEPYPERLMERLAGAPTQHRIIAEPIQSVDPALFDSLVANDIVFIDSTHVLRTGGDVVFELFEILPRLRRASSSISTT